MIKDLGRNAVVLGGALLALSLATTSHAQVTIGNSNSNNVFPFGITSYVGEYQQVYASAAFPGPITITSITFKTLSGFGNTSITDNLSLGLSTTSASVSAPSTSYASNKGADFTTVFTGAKVISGGTDTFDTVFSITPFTYNPALGNLLLDVFVTSNTGGQVVLSAGTGSADTSRIFNSGGSGAATLGSGQGLQTQFAFRSSSTVPEPGAMALLLGSGMTGCFIAFRRLRRR